MTAADESTENKTSMAVAALHKSLHSFPVLPPRDLFTDITCEPKFPEDPALAKTAADFCAVIAEQLRQLAHLTAALDATLLGVDALTSLATATRRSRQHGVEDAPLPGILIEEVYNDDQNDDAQNKLPPLAITLFLAASQFGLDDKALLARPWVTLETNAASKTLLSTLLTTTSTCSSSSTSTSTPSTSSSTSVVALFLSSAIDALRATLTAPADHAATETTRLVPYTGPDAWERGLAASQLAAMVFCLTADDVDACKVENNDDFYWQQHLFPLLSVTVQDPSPTVQNYGIWALNHILTISSAKALAPWTHQVVQLLKKVVLGCDERCWRAALSAATTMALKCEAYPPTPATSSSSALPYNPLFVSLFEALLEEGERHAHSPKQASLWLQSVPAALFPPFGLQLARYFRRLMPLLLEWCVSVHKEVRLGGVRALHAVLRAAWPRMTMHASLIWSVLEHVCTDETTLSARTSQDVIDAVVGVGAALWQCGGEEFQEGLMWKKEEAAAAAAAGEVRLVETVLNVVVASSNKSGGDDVSDGLSRVKIVELE